MEILLYFAISESGCALFFHKTHNYFLLMSFTLFVSRAQERLLLLLYFLHQAETFYSQLTAL